MDNNFEYTREWFEYHGPNIGLAGLLFALLMAYLHGPQPLLVTGGALATVGFVGGLVAYMLRRPQEKP